MRGDYSTNYTIQLNEETRKRLDEIRFQGKHKTYADCIRTLIDKEYEKTQKEL